MQSTVAHLAARLLIQLLLMLDAELRCNDFSAVGCSWR